MNTKLASFNKILIVLAALNPSSLAYANTIAQSPSSQNGAQNVPQNAQGLSPQFVWEDRKQYQECDQECLVRKSNEILSFEENYVKGLAQELTKNPKDLSKAAKTLGTFCGPSEPAKKCVERYTYLLKKRMESVHGMMGYNSDQALELNTQAVSLRTKNPDFEIKGVSTFQYHDPSRPRGKAELAKKMHSYESEEADKFLRRFGKSFESPQELQAFLDESWREPKLQDYPKLTSVPRNPNDPNGDSMLVVERNADGSIQYDEVKFNKERATFLAMKNDLQSDMTAYGQRRLLELQKADPAVAADPVKAAKTEEKKAYDDTKALMERTLASKAAEKDPNVMRSTFVEMDQKDLEADLQALEVHLQEITASIQR